MSLPLSLSRACACSFSFVIFRFSWWLIPLVLATSDHPFPSNINFFNIILDITLPAYLKLTTERNLYKVKKLRIKKLMYYKKNKRKNGTIFFFVIKQRFTKKKVGTA